MTIGSMHKLAQSSGNRKALLSKYIAKKNQQVKNAFLRERELAQSAGFPFSTVSTAKVPTTLAATEERKALAESIKNLEHARSSLAQSELIRDIAEIAHFSADIKVQQERQQEDMTILRDTVHKYASGVRKLTDSNKDAEMIARIKNQLFLDRLRDLDGKIDALVDTFEQFKVTNTEVLARLEVLETEKYMLVGHEEVSVQDMSTAIDQALEGLQVEEPAFAEQDLAESDLVTQAATTSFQVVEQTAQPELEPTALASSEVEVEESTFLVPDLVVTLASAPLSPDADQSGAHQSDSESTTSQK